MNTLQSTQKFINQFDQLSKTPIDILAITHKDWLGVKYATGEIFEHIIEIEELILEQEITTLGEYILSYGIKKVVFSGFARGWNRLCSYLKDKNPSIKIMIFWHGNTTHMYEAYSWERHLEIMELMRNQTVDQLAFAKKGICPVYEKLGFNVIHLKNYVKKWGSFPYIAEDETYDLTKPVRIGIYASGEMVGKNAYTQIAAASLFKDATISLIPNHEKMLQFANMLGVKVIQSKASVSRARLQIEMAKNTINFYATLTECAPLLPLESLNSGVLCLVGNNHHYFEGHSLKEWLVVEQMDNPEAIYHQACKALQNKGKILKLYEQWYKDNVKQVEEVLKKL